MIELNAISKNYGSFAALYNISFTIKEGEVTCVLGDNGAGKSTLIKILAGIHQPDTGTMVVDGVETTFTNPRAALDHGIATVYQDLAVVGQMSVWRNFFLGQELSNRWGILKRAEMAHIAHQQLNEMGVDLPSVDTPISSLSGGQRQVVAIARAIYFGARVLILDEPTAALGVKQSGMVLKFIAAARSRGIGVVFVTHNPHHAYLVGDHFTILNLGRQILDSARSDTSVAELTRYMSGGSELEALSHELEGR
ncbi:ATP-binding cassette domain-containing protein [Corynebacterium sp. ES2775-CONJ]|uniref:ATP-binding cassette domain-containing protein n=1 Tax=Corynebacterium sp. ES2775-CONJ TaxID=2974029 RepID=UPI002167EF20|nr:ATP-binding cassette domain-containing protein [Corynebacterium sp. ES2775-CONJ]MCS4490430.1 ATP-binding cassette domain-containing protein [Corynebacterium sp. ES2775-CONJ]